MAGLLRTVFSFPRRGRDEGGQVLILGALILPMVLGMSALAIDLGSFSAQRRSLQNDADAIALAAAQDLPDQAEAMKTALEWADHNGIDPAKMDVTFSGLSAGSQPKVTVVVEQDVSFAFARIIGFSDAEVSARAAAMKSSYGGGRNIVPWAVLETIVSGAGNGDLVTMKYDSNNVLNGNFGAVRIDGSGASDYEDSVTYGSNSTLCAITTPGCDAALCTGGHSSCSETAPDCNGPDCKPKTGNMVGGTRDGVDYRMDNTTTDCDTFEKTFSEDASGNFQLRPICNPWTDAGSDNLRIIVIPIVDTFGNGSSDDLEIQSFALMYLEGYETNKCKGSECEITGRFIKNSITIQGLTGAYDPGAPLQSMRLSE